MITAAIKLLLVLITIVVLAAPLYLLYIVVLLPLYNSAWLSMAQLCNIPILLLLSVIGFTAAWVRLNK